METESLSLSTMCRTACLTSGLDFSPWVPDAGESKTFTKISVFPSAGGQLPPCLLLEHHRLLCQVVTIHLPLNILYPRRDLPTSLGQTPLNPLQRAVTALFISLTPQLSPYNPQELSSTS